MKLEIGLIKRSLLKDKAMLGIVLLISFIAFTTPAHSDIIFHQDFEDGEENSGKGFTPKNEHCCEKSIQNVTSYSHDGDRALYTLIEEGDAGSKGHTARANLSVSPGNKINGKSVLPYDKDRWFGFSVLIPESSKDSVTRINIFNTHSHNWGTDADGNSCSIPAGKTNTPISFKFLGHNYKWSGPGSSRPLKYYWALFSHPSGTNDGDDRGYLQLMDATADIGKWVNFVFHFRLTYKEDQGLLEVWKDGKRVYHNDNFDLADSQIPQSCGEVYPKIGVGAAFIATDGPSGYPMEVYYDSIRWGDENSSFAEVDPAQDEGQFPHTCGANNLRYCDGRGSCENAGGNWCHSFCQRNDCRQPESPKIISTNDLRRLPFGTTSAEVEVKTDKDASCKYFYEANETITPSNMPYADMPYEFERTGGKVHTQSMPNLKPISDFWYGVKCADRSGAVSAQENVRVTVLRTAPNDPPKRNKVKNLKILSVETN